MNLKYVSKTFVLLANIIFMPTAHAVDAYAYAYGVSDSMLYQQKIKAMVKNIGADQFMLSIGIEGRGY